MMHVYRLVNIHAIESMIPFRRIWKGRTMADLVLSETHDRVTVLTLNRPEKLNALNYALIDRLLAILDTLETDNAVRAVILTGAGERAFSAGGDINEFSLSI